MFHLMIRFAVLAGLVALACLLAAAYGAVHNQVSYSIGPEYFHAFKFIQFNIAPALPPRTGAAIVGVHASWWMGAIIGLPIALICAFAPTAGRMILLFLRATALVLIITFVLGLATLLVPMALIPIDLIPIPTGVTDPSGFIRAAIMHDTSYMGGVVALFVGMGYALIYRRG